MFQCLCSLGAKVNFSCCETCLIKQSLTLCVILGSSVPQKHQNSSGLWMAEAVAFLLRWRHRQVRHRYYWHRNHLSEWVFGLHRKAGHHTSHRQVDIYRDREREQGKRERWCLLVYCSHSPCYCSMPGRVVSFEAYCQWVLLSVQITRHYPTI